MIITNVEGLRDPFVLVVDGVYYLYGTAVGSDWDDTQWGCYVNDSGRLDGEWKRTPQPVYVRPEDALKQLWAPEVHYYRGKYYMIGTYFSKKTQHRGCAVLSSDSPTGPFVEISDGHVTPHDRDSIDATLYVDEVGQPWLVYVHEWTCTEDRIGRMDMARLSDDLSKMISEPVELFRADAPIWTNDCVTDGCFMYTTENKRLLMLWSNFYDTDRKYCIAVAESESGTVEGPWKQPDAPFFTIEQGGGYDGGHGMIFTDVDGQKYLCLHCPNRPTEEMKERTVFVPIKEVDNQLVIADV